jgi:hypothetical protein
MQKNKTLTKIEKEIDKLTSDQQLKLLERLIHRIKLMKKRHKRELDWKKLYRLGKGLWNNEDAQEYVNWSRQDRL